MATGRLRIVAGELGGRRIEVPRGTVVRPTPERVREALFSMLGERVGDARVLDAYAGTGALGFEAASRGAASVVQIEADSRVADVLALNAGRLGLAGRCRLLRGAVGAVLRAGRARGPFDLVFADPPYAGGERPAFLGWVAPLLAPGALVVVERASRDAAAPPAPESGLRLVREARYGDTSLDFYSAG